MEPLIQLNAIAAPLRLANVNTDQLFPARFIKKPRAVGYAQYLFHDIRRTDAGNINTDFSLNQRKFETAKILFAGANFGLEAQERGLFTHSMTRISGYFRAKLWRDICSKLSQKRCPNRQWLIKKPSIDSRELDHAQPPQVSVNVDQESITLPSGDVVDFDLDPFQKHCLMNGLNEIDLSLEFNDAITAFEENHRKTFPWTML